MTEGHAKRPRRPALHPEWDALAGAADPADRTTLAHQTAALLVDTGRGRADPALTRRLVDLVDEVGLDALAALWKDSPPATLPGTLWQVYLLRTWVHRSAAEAARLYAAGRRVAEVADVVAGVADPPGPREVAELGDAVLTSVYDGDLAVALERAAAFCRVVAAGRAHLADDADELPGESGATLTRLASGNLRMAEQLEAAAALWRHNSLT